MSLKVAKSDSQKQTPEEDAASAVRQVVVEVVAGIAAACLLLTFSSVGVSACVFVAVLVGGWARRRAQFLRKCRHIPGHPVGCQPLGDLWKGFTMPPVPGTNPPAPDLMKMWYDLQDDFREHGLFKLWAGHPYMPLSTIAVVIFDPELVKELLSAQHFGDCRKGTPYDVSAPLIGKHSILALGDGEEWRFLRKLVKSGFHQDVIKNAVPITAGVVDTLSRRWDEEGAVTVDSVEETLKVTMDVFGKVAMSHDFRSVHATTTSEAPLWDAFDLILKELCNRCQNPTWLIPGWGLARKRAFSNAIGVLDKHIDCIVRERMRASTEGSDSPRAYGRDLLSLLLSTAEKDVEGLSRSFTERELCDNLRTLLFAGHDTTASAMAWSLHVLASPEHARVERRLREEVLQLCPPGTTPSWTDIEDMPYLSAFVWEVLRIWPSAAFARCTNRDVQIGKHLLPKGAELFVYPQLLQRDAANWDDPMAFRPERWLPAEGHTTCDAVEQIKTDAEKKGTFLPFSLGLRNCVGRALAFVELRTAIVCFMQRYRFHLVPGAPPPMQVLYMTTGPNSLPIQLERV
eukprot:TRINITY_DN39767_c0_g1_i1.p1 TRINITY_DN39767_c0_g1~~TRINITY_DN39767_c0_g1_i1.p1  ORF type:complete len:571 (+),score=151.74 TRINITY_DN39767_c0_g1_i1:53-1765(+)